LGAAFRLHDLLRFPLTFSLEAGVVFSSFSDTAGYAANSGAAHPYQFIDSAEYPKTVTGVFNLSVKIFW
jgi:hypothetical protein